jgi:S1-C subfamily serine protease
LTNDSKYGIIYIQAGTIFASTVDKDQNSLIPFDKGIHMFSTIRKLFAALFLSLAIAGCAVTPAPTQTIQPFIGSPVVATQVREVAGQLGLKSEAQAYIAGETTRFGFCSLVMIGPETAYTANHCVSSYLPREDGATPDDISQLAVVKDGHLFSVKGLYADAQGRDLVLMRIEGLGCPCAVPAGTPANRDEPVVAVGYPYSVGQIVTYGFVQTRWYDEDDGQVYLISTASAAPGNSGGPLFVIRDGQAYLIGIVVLGIGANHIVGAVELP